MVTRREIVEKIEMHLGGQISAEELNAWALDILVREQEDESIEGIIIGDAIGVLNMLHDDDARLRVSNSELVDLKDTLQGKKSYEVKRLVQKDFAYGCPEICMRIKEAVASLRRGVPAGLDELVAQCKASDPGTVQGLLIQHVASLLQLASSAVRRGLGEAYIVADYSSGTVHVPVGSLTGQLESVYRCLVGESPFVLTIVEHPGQVRQVCVLISA